ncbi:MAG: hypothetical protein ACR2JU_02945 [Nocardioidaceae bacterium]
MDSEPKGAGRVEEACVVRHDGVGVDSEGRGETEGVPAPQMCARDESCLVEQRPGWVNEVDTSEQIGHRRLVDFEAHGETA